MKRISITASVALAAFAFSLFATATALALPDVSISLGGSYPIHAEGSNATAVSTETTASGTVFEGIGVTVLALTKELTSLGEFTSTFTKVHEPGKPAEECHTVGGSKGVVLVTGIFHAVLTSKPEQLASLFLIKETEIICPKLECAVEGSLISTLHAGTEKEELTKVGGTLLGTKGKQELTEYINDSGTISKAELLVNCGAGLVVSSQNIPAEVKLEILEGKMIAITGR